MIVVYIIAKNIMRLKKGETPGCSCGCSGCSTQGGCHSDVPEKK